MITRIWHGKTKKEDKEEYLNYLHETGLKDYKKAENCLSAKILVRDSKNCSHFYTVSEWKDIESIKKFAGNDINIPKYYVEDQKFLLEFEKEVFHYETYLHNSPALLIIDMQEAFFEDALNLFDAKGLVKRINLLIEKFRNSNYPIIFIRHCEETGPLQKDSVKWQIFSEIASTTTDYYINKDTPDSFNNTSLNENLKDLGVTTLYVAGLQTDFCIDTTCRSAFKENFKTILIDDAHSTFDNEFLDAESTINYHHKILSRWFVRLQPTHKVLEDLSQL